MNKRGIYTIIAFVALFIFLLTGVYAQENSTSINKAYQCIKDKVEDDCSSLTLDEQLATMLALGNYKDCKEELLSNSRNQECWPKGNCKLKETSLALLALEESGASSSQKDKVKSWLLNQTKTVSELTWYLQIESDEATTCKISYPSSSASTVTILSNKKIGSISSSCFSVSENSYWLKISQSCLDKEFTISCDQDFSTTLLYKTPDSSTIHVSQNIQSSVKGGELIEQVIYKCFKEGTICNYEGSLWASIALLKYDVDSEIYLPYLESFSQDNSQFFPEAFLYILTSSQEYLPAILQDNFKGNFWQISTYGKYYDTAIALLALRDENYDQVDSSIEYLLNGKTQNSNGCWNNIKDTGLLLYSNWQDSGQKSECNSDSDCEGDRKCVGGLCRSSSDKDCIKFGNFCENRLDCLDSSGSVLSDFQGCSSTKVCCSVEVKLKTCTEQSGTICDSDQTCPSSASILSSSDYGVCCSKKCEDKTVPSQPECIKQGYECRQNSCFDDESESSLDCSSLGDVCCYPVSNPDPDKSYWWIWILLILIILVIVAIIFRDKIRLFFFKRKSGFKSGPAPRETRPPFFPPGQSRMMPRPSPNGVDPRFIRPLPPRNSQVQKPVIHRDKEFDETLRKLKDISK